MGYSNFIYMRQQGFVFAYVPKVACTNWKCLMRYMAKYGDWLDTRLAHDKKAGGLRYLDLGVAKDAALLSNPALPKYAMVRNPYSRALSAYLNKIALRLPVKPEGVGDHFDAVARVIDGYRQEVLGAQDFPEVNFEVFLRWVLNEARVRGNGHMRRDEHWRPMVDLLRWSQTEYSILGRFETLTEDAARLLDAMGCDQHFPSQKQVKFAPTNATDNQSLYYTPQTRALVQKIFSDDFEVFGYQTKITL